MNIIMFCPKILFYPNLENAQFLEIFSSSEL